MVISIIGLLASVVLVAVSRANQSAQESNAIQYARQVNTALELYLSDHNGVYPFQDLISYNGNQYLYGYAYGSNGGTWLFFGCQVGLDCGVLGNYINISASPEFDQLKKDLPKQVGFVFRIHSGYRVLSGAVPYTFGTCDLNMVYMYYYHTDTNIKWTSNNRPTQCSTNNTTYSSIRFK